MSVVQKALREAGMKVVGDALPKEHRGVRAFQRLIAAMRACEAEVQERLADSERQLNEALRELVGLRDQLHALQNEVAQHRLREGLAKVDSLSTTDRNKLIELAQRD